MLQGATTATSKAAVGYEYCNKLFALEVDMTPFQREVMRQMKAKPLLDAYWAWAEKLDWTQRRAASWRTR